MKDFFDALYLGLKMGSAIAWLIVIDWHIFGYWMTEDVYKYQWVRILLLPIGIPVGFISLILDFIPRKKSA